MDSRSLAFGNDVHYPWGLVAAEKAQISIVLYVMGF
jgi:hypothetical protein